MPSITDEINQLLAQPPGQTTPAPVQDTGSISGEINTVLSGNAPPVKQPQPQQPSFWANTGTALARAAGNLLEGAGQSGLAETGAPSDQMPKPGEIAATTVNGLTGGQPYQAQTPVGRFYQDALARTATGLPLSVMGGPLGIAMNVTGSVGGELGRRALPSHPIVGDIVGSTVGSLAAPVGMGIGRAGVNAGSRLLGTQGAVENEAANQFAQQPAYNMPLSQVDQTLANQGGSYWTPGRIAAASELNKRQTVSGLLPPTSPAGPSAMTTAILDHGLGGVGLAAGGAIDHFLTSHLGIPPGIMEGLGLGAGEVAQNLIKPFVQNRTAAFNQSVQNFMKNNSLPLWQQYQQQQMQPGLMQSLLQGAAVPIATGMDRNQ